MIYYFSGTGNSRYVAEHVAAIVGDSVSDITASLPLDGDVLGIVFPVYAWGVPAIVEDFISRSRSWADQAKYVYAIMTHGDDMGYADCVLRKCLAAVGVKLDAVFSVSMPNTYVCLPGFDVDAPQMAESKVAATTSTLPHICQQIRNRAEVVEVTRGALPRTKTYVLRPLFNRFLVTDKYFRHTEASCNGCGKCARQCPLHNIVMTDNHPAWQGNCTGCLRCYHLCPNNSIQFGRFTVGKGQQSL